MTKDVFSKLSLRDKRYFEPARVNMIKQQIRTWDVLDDQVLELFDKVHREDFVPVDLKPLAFADINIPLAQGQTMMTPKEEAKIIQELKIQGTDKVLVVGIESGFLLALTSKLGGKIYYTNSEITSFEEVKNKMERHRFPNVNFLIGRQHDVWHDYSPFNVIILTGSLPRVPEDLKLALAINGRLFVAIGKPPVMEATLVTRLSENTWCEQKLFETFRPRMLDAKEPNPFIL